jgi:hypothetical protein
MPDAADGDKTGIASSSAREHSGHRTDNAPCRPGKEEVPLAAAAGHSALLGGRNAIMLTMEVGVWDVRLRLVEELIESEEVYLRQLHIMQHVRCLLSVCRDVCE